MGTNKKITMKEIAEIAGVTKTTISRYFNGGYLKEETKKRIREIISEYDYEPNTFARLKAKKSHIIGIIVPALDSTVGARVLTGIEKTLREKHYMPIIMNTNHQHKLELQYIEKLKRLNVDGIVLSATYITEEHKNILKKSDIPIVIYGQECSEGISIVNDDYNAGIDIGKYIGSKNHKNIGFITVDENDIAVGITRRNGVLDGLKKYGIENIKIEVADFSYEKAKTAAENLLKNKDIDAIICSTDRQALGVYKVLKEMGLKIPDDVSVISFGGYDIDEIIEPELSTIKFDSFNAGVCTANTLIDLINNIEVKEVIYVNYEFLERNSVR
ncbi:LacI family DNA-binding transcriptional regulator [Brachyspira hampsonii]|uniref:LacI family transcriptional regulator n=1 Tax=Brachyspira hampsonii TaxID=1287055 RepID=A0AAC9XL23_9SPIR|nr:LacI family DNA-binding transcriptional regulator [Brachyspira hampsonii]ASJ22407.1 LacI family transcriptional regulator [Brachyspira hampsonii]ELV06188.1 sucrose operon repressor [Brachyspira hampsonii 30599]MBW5381470.1 LacI family transcriptional regulator [Brachyspira hampsonii]OEJ18240.1 LacI family transcriptional regulator [Brachyspira hampsonii]